MTDRARNGRPTGTRRPLSEIRNTANTPPVSQRPSKGGKAVSVSPHVLPHNESLELTGNLTARGSTSTSPEHKRVSQIVSEHERDSKRNSAISTASTSASGRRRKTYIGHWQLGKTIGKGGCSRVRIVRHKTRDQYGAVKIITRAAAESTRAQSLANLIESTKSSMICSSSGYKPIPHGLEREIAIMKLLEHPNIVRLYDVWENRNELYLIMEYVDGGELFHYVDERRGLPEDETVYIFRQIVSALLYCHRLLICHRDLKPENILLDRRDLTVKLIDFGMAALQPEGRLLSTPCGSPHYAAPEVLSSRPYDGRQADVWSCGVILYVMLTGTPPYNYTPDGDIRDLFRDITRANYRMPQELSLEAKDLIRRIFVPEPKRRISMDDVWDHPLLHKYDNKFGFVGEAGCKEVAIGQIPKATDFRVKRVQDIDREILRNMRTLWHSEPEQTLIQKLVNTEVNQEKLFYAALIKHREENLENYAGTDDMDYSNSDYHHHHDQGTASTTPPLPPMKAPRSQSQYSIMNDEHLKPSNSFVAPPPSISSSYDPYRASKSQVVNGHGDRASVVVHRHGSSGAQRSSVARNQRQPNISRVEMLRHGQASRRASNQSSSSLARSARSRSSMQRSSTSKYSMTSSHWPSSPPVIATMRPSDVHKRGVSFGHMRRVSIASAAALTESEKAPPTPKIPQALRIRSDRQSSVTDHSSPSPVAAKDHQLRSRKERVPMLDFPRIQARNTDAPKELIRNDIRKHSAELEKACQDAFFRSSAGSSLTARTTFSEKNDVYDTPPSSISARDSSALDRLDVNLGPRPLPEIPTDTPDRYLTRAIEEMRDKLVAYKPTDNTKRADYDNFLRALENITPGPHRLPDKRATSAPETKGASQHLPMITEESDHRSSRDGRPSWYRSVTAPVSKEGPHQSKTVRMVTPSSPDSVAPLNLRKYSQNTVANDENQRQRSTRASHEQMDPGRLDEPLRILEAINEDPTSQATPVIRGKKSGWFGMSKKHDELCAKLPALETPDTRDHGCNRKTPPHRVLSKPVPSAKKSSAAQQDRIYAEELLPQGRLGRGKKGLARWLGRSVRDKAENTDDAPQSTTSRDSLFSPASPSASSYAGDETTDAVSTAGPSRSWFARFFHVKPAMKILCFAIPRGRARQELVLLLREWQRHGIRDLRYSRETNTLTARVARRNSLAIKPVTFRIELFVVLEHGRRVGLSLARFVQIKGAVSGFRRVIEVIDGVMRGRGWLVEEEEKWKALCEIVGG